MSPLFIMKASSTYYLLREAFNKLVKRIWHKHLACGDRCVSPGSGALYFTNLSFGWQYRIAQNTYSTSFSRHI